jgi:hypothetical protein
MTVTFKWVYVAAADGPGWQFPHGVSFSFKKQENKLQLSLYLVLSQAGAQDTDENSARGWCGRLCY